MKHGEKWVVGALMGFAMTVGQPMTVGASARLPGGEAVDGETAFAEEEDIRGPATLVGDVLIRTDAQGRLAVVVDSARAGMPADGIADRLFIFESERPLTEPVERRLFLASIVFGGRSLSISAPGTSFTVDARLGSANDQERRIGEDRIVLHDGIALQSRRLGPDHVGVEAVATDNFVTTYDGSGGSEGTANSCQSGGSGASNCNRNCSFSSASISRGDGCGIECREGYYACCNCTWLYEASCSCQREQTIDPKKPQLGVDTR